jgi:hypothetical protein
MTRSFARDLSVVWFLALSLFGSTALLRADDENPFGETRKQQTENDDPFANSKAPASRAPADGKVQTTVRPAANDQEASERIRKALDHSTHMEFIETPLQDAVDYLKDLHQIEIQLDTKSMEEAGVGTDTPMTRTIKGISLGAALRLLLSPVDLTHVVKDGVLQITTVDALDQVMELRVHNVKDLLQTDTSVDELAGILRMALAVEMPATEHRAARKQRVGIVGGHSLAAVTMSPAQPVPLAPHAAPEIATFGDLIVVRASTPEQEAIAKLLDEMREKLQLK